MYRSPCAPGWCIGPRTHLFHLNGCWISSAAMPQTSRGSRWEPTPARTWMPPYTAQLEVADGEGVAEDVGADALAGDAGALLEAREHERHPVLGQRGARLGQEEVVLPGAAPLGQFLLVGAVLVQVVQQVAQAVLPQGHAPLLRPLALEGEDAALAVEVGEAQPAQLRNADAGVVEDPQDGAVA